jgi:hypothetical protein
MKRLTALAAVILAFVAFTVSPTQAHAFGLSGIGARVGGVDPEGAGGSVLVGGHLEFEESGTKLHLQPGVMYWSSDRLSDFNPNFDVMYHFARSSEVSPYVGAGAGLHFYSLDVPGGANSSNTDLGANLFGGVLLPSNSVRMFIEGRFVASDRSQASINGGVTLPFGHH